MNAKDYLSRYEIMDGWIERMDKEYGSHTDCFGVELLQDSVPEWCHDVEKELETVISQVDDFLPAMVLRFRYLYFLDLKEIMRITGYSRSTVDRLHSRGLKCVQEILDRKEGVSE